MNSRAFGSRVRRAWRRLRRPVPGVGLVIGYHRVAAVESDLFGLTVRPEHFEEQLEAIVRLAHPVSLSELVVPKAPTFTDGRPRVALTFDDGYTDVLQTAAPALARRRVPATVFLVSGSLGEVFWWDRLALMLPQVDTTRPLRLESRGRTLRWDPPSSGAGAAPKSLKRTLHAFLRTDTEEGRLATLAALSEEIGGEPSLGASTRSIDAEEARNLASLPGIEVGAHGVSHVPLGEVPEEQVRREVVDSRRTLEQILGVSVDGFAYPHGSVSPTAQRVVEEMGFRRACTSRERAVGRRDLPFEIPRVWAPDTGGEAFVGWLRRWLP